MTQWIDNNLLEWVDSNDNQWGLGEVYTTLQISTDASYIYVATSIGLKIYDIASELEYAYVTYSGGINTVWNNDNYVFLGTSISGVKYINKTCISGSVVSPYDLVTCLNDFSDLTYYHTLTSDYIRYIHGSGDVLCMVTNSGVDVVKIDPQSYRSYTSISGAKKCFMTAAGKFYYTVSGTEWSLNRVDSCLYDWSVPDKSYTTGSGILPAGEKINDIFITENTASDGVSNTIFCATSSGVFVIDEGTECYINFTTASGLHGSSDDFTAIWADANAGLSAGKMYIGLEGYFNVVNLEDNSLYDCYGEVIIGRANEPLDNSAIVDINVS